MNWNRALSYTKINDALIIPATRPRHRAFSSLVGLYPLIAGLFITGALLVGTLPYAPAWGAFWVAVYWLYFFANDYFRRHDSLFRLNYWSMPVQVLKSVVLVFVITLIIGYVYATPAYANATVQIDLIWPLYLLAIFITCQHGRTEYLLFVVGLASTMLILVSWLAHPDAMLDLAYVLATLTKVGWLIFLSFVLHILIRAIASYTASLQLVVNVQEQIEEEQISRLNGAFIEEEAQMLKIVVDAIARSFGYRHVLAFLLHSGDTLKCVASASQEGARLAEDGFSLSLNEPSIVSHVVSIKDLYCTDDVRQDPHYLVHAAFPHTKSEMAVPICVDGSLIGVLDIQEHYRSAFLQEDQDVMRIMAGQLGRAIGNLRLMAHKQQISDIIQDIAFRLLSQHELQATLDEIAQAAQDELKADIVMLFERNTTTGAVKLGSRIGELLHPDRFEKTLDDSLRTVQHIIAKSERYYFHTDALHLEAQFPPEKFSDRLEPAIVSFVQQEQIVSRAILQLGTGLNCMGVMFLNFRQRRQFTSLEKQKFFVFANLATLAIQKAQLHQEEIQSEREALAWQLHDQIMGNAFTVSQILSTLARTDLPVESRSNKIKVAQAANEELMQHVRYLHLSWRDIPVDDLKQEIDRIIERAQRSYSIQFRYHWLGDPAVVSPLVIYHFRFILSEAIINAVKYSRATRFTVVCENTDGFLHLHLSDNGRGFDTKSVTMSGLENMRGRANQLGGALGVDSEPEGGTHISIGIPMVHAGDHS